MSEIGDPTPIQTSHVADVEPAEDEDMYGSDSGEVKTQSPGKTFRT